jgi:hypothetical protein
MPEIHHRPYIKSIWGIWQSGTRRIDGVGEVRKAGRQKVEE